MPIPNLNEQGLLPPGIYDCSLEEIGERFGTFQSTDRRSRLYEKLQEYLTQVRTANLAIAVIVNGSFVTGKADPNDIDLILVLPSSHALRAELVPMAYNVLSRRRVRRQYGFDILVAREDATEYTQYVEFFRQVRGQPHLYKGVLRIGL
jgi:predicted nucleotidyltransferase